MAAVRPPPHMTKYAMLDEPGMPKAMCRTGTAARRDKIKN